MHLNCPGEEVDFSRDFVALLSFLTLAFTYAWNIFWSYFDNIWCRFWSYFGADFDHVLVVILFLVFLFWHMLSLMPGSLDNWNLPQLKWVIGKPFHIKYPSFVSLFGIVSVIYVVGGVHQSWGKTFRTVMSTIFVSGFISLSVQSNFMLFEWNMATTEEKENIARTLTEYGQDWWKWNGWFIRPILVTACAFLNL